jgi:tripartite-type tricarboxylate transporter receptor subunit TctC
MAVETLAPLAGQFRAGTLHAMAVTSRERFSEMPDVPTVFESGYPGYDVSSWNGIVAPAGMPADRIATLNAAIDKVLGQPDVKQRFADLGFVAAGGTPAAFGTLIHDEITRWSGVIERAHIEKQ